MKRLLAAGSGDIYQLCKVFRDGELRPLAQPGIHAARVVPAGIRRCGADDARSRRSWAQLLAPERRFAAARTPELCRSHAPACRRRSAHRRARMSSRSPPRASALARVMPTLDRDARARSFDGTRGRPAARARAAVFHLRLPRRRRPRSRGSSRACRRWRRASSCIWTASRLANGFHELSNAARTARAVRAGSRHRRRAADRSQPPMDERLLGRARCGMPDCAGVALGFDRLVAIALGARALVAGDGVLDR